MSDAEFGAGIVVCLAKFSEHLHEHGPYSERAIREFASWSDAEHARRAAEAEKFPLGDSAAKLLRMSLYEGSADRGGREAAISDAIGMWMNAASDHFYELDQEKAPKPLRELADLTLRIGHGFTEETWTIETMDRIRELWRDSCLAVDRMLGVEPDWGKW